MEPSPSSSAELVRYQFPKTTDANLKGATTYTAAQKKRLADKAYRERCKVKPFFFFSLWISLKFN
jgi:hypothetical protein